jgi:hypothetical protein
MTLKFKMRFIKPGTLEYKSISRELRNQLWKESIEIKRQYKLCVSTFHEKSKFVNEKVPSEKDAIVRVWTDDPRFLWLDKGTKIRWALMSGDWQSKTRPHWVGAGRGKGRAVLVGKRAFRKRGLAPRPGIEARHFTEDILKAREKPFKIAMQEAFKIGAENAWSK